MRRDHRGQGGGGEVAMQHWTANDVGAYSDGMKKRSFEAVKLTLYVPVEQKEKLDRLSEETGAPLTVHVRRALDAYLGDRLSTPRRRKG
jgi:hypothetical protein